MNPILLGYLIGFAVTFFIFVIVDLVDVPGFKRMGFGIVLIVAVAWPYTWIRVLVLNLKRMMKKCRKEEI